MTKLEHLKLLRRMLHDWRYTRWFPWLSRDYKTHHGFCYYLQEYDIKYYDIPELHIQRPRETWKKLPNFWFKPGKKTPRIKALKAAIKLLENSYDDE